MFSIFPYLSSKIKQNGKARRIRTPMERYRKRERERERLRNKAMLADCQKKIYQQIFEPMITLKGSVWVQTTISSSFYYDATYLVSFLLVRCFFIIESFLFSFFFDFSIFRKSFSFSSNQRFDLQKKKVYLLFYRMQNRKLKTFKNNFSL